MTDSHHADLIAAHMESPVVLYYNDFGSIDLKSYVLLWDFDRAFP